MRIENFKNPLVSKFTSAITIIALLVLIAPVHMVKAAGLTVLSDTVTNEGISQASRHKILFTSTSTITSSGTIAVTFPSSFTTTGLVITDLQICHGTTGLNFGTATITGGTACSTATETIAASNGANTVWGAVISGTTTITFTAPTSMTNVINPADIVTIQIAAVHMINPGTIGSKNVTIATTSDTGDFSIPIYDADSTQVKITATVPSSITFDLDTYNTSTTSTEIAAPYAVALGTLSTASVSGTTEGGGATPNGIWFDLDTNATGGAIVSVTSANAALKSTSTPAHTIPSLAGTNTMTAGTANYGVCANRNAVTGSGTLSKIAPFNGTCTTTPAGNAIPQLTTSAQTIYNTASAPISGGRGEIMVDAAISTATVAHADYTDNLTLLAIGTF